MILWNGKESKLIYTKCSCIFPKCNARDGIPETFEKLSRMLNETTSGSSKKVSGAIMITAVGMLARSMGYFETLFIWIGLLASQVHGHGHEETTESPNTQKIRFHLEFGNDNLI